MLRQCKKININLFSRKQRFRVNGKTKKSKINSLINEKIYFILRKYKGNFHCILKSTDYYSTPSNLKIHYSTSTQLVFQLDYQ